MNIHNGKNVQTARRDALDAVEELKVNNEGKYSLVIDQILEVIKNCELVEPAGLEEL